jgi:hypothetical protein
LAVQLSQQIAENNFTDHSEIMHSSNEALVASASSTDVLLHELQLGEQLNESVVQTRRADFSLMLAMLAEDVREQSQFTLPKAQHPVASNVSNSALRKEFHLPDTAALGLSSMDEVDQFNQAQSVIDNDIANIRLQSAMTPNPLAFRDDRQHIATEVLQNTSLFCQLKHQQAQAIKTAGNDGVQPVDQPLTKSLNFNAKAWLDSVQQSLVNAPLIN